MPKASFRGLQAADMLAYEGFKDFTRQVAVTPDHRPVRRLYEVLRKTGRLAVAIARRRAFPPRFASMRRPHAGSRRLPLNAAATPPITRRTIASLSDHRPCATRYRSNAAASLPVNAAH